MSKLLPMRLAFREEGTEWVAYCAKPDTMDDAIRIGSVAFSIVASNDEAKEAFMTAMKVAIGAVTQAFLGSNDLTWTDPVPAPEHERSGHG